MFFVSMFCFLHILLPACYDPLWPLDVSTVLSFSNLETQTNKCFYNRFKSLFYNVCILSLQIMSRLRDKTVMSFIRQWKYFFMLCVKNISIIHTNPVVLSLLKSLLISRFCLSRRFTIRNFRESLKRPASFQDQRTSSYFRLSRKTVLGSRNPPTIVLCSISGEGG